MRPNGKGGARPCTDRRATSLRLDAVKPSRPRSARSSNSVATCLGVRSRRPPDPRPRSPPERGGAGAGRHTAATPSRSRPIERPVDRRCEQFRPSTAGGSGLPPTGRRSNALLSDRRCSAPGTPLGLSLPLQQVRQGDPQPILEITAQPQRRCTACRSAHASRSTSYSASGAQELWPCPYSNVT
jgi:hypothetical protein